MGAEGAVFSGNESPGCAEVPEECDFTHFAQVSQHAGSWSAEVQLRAGERNLSNRVIQTDRKLCASRFSRGPRPAAFVPSCFHDSVQSWTETYYILPKKAYLENPGLGREKVFLY